MKEEQNILSVDHLQIAFAGDGAFVAVHDLSFRLKQGQTLAIVGESGSGKSLTALSLMGLLPATATVKGKIKLTTGEGALQLDAFTNNKDWQRVRGSAIGIVFQEPMSALNPVMRIGQQLAEAIALHQKASKKQAKEAAIDWLRKVQLPNPEKIYARYPHQLSGGQKQRVMIAMAMCNHPVLLIADEPTTALDVTVQQEIINLMKQLQQEHHTAMIFITHDLALAATIADDVLVMYKGEVVEYGAASDVLHYPQQPYTKALLACKPSAGQKGHRLPVVSDFLNNTAQHLTTGIPHVMISTDVLLQVNDLRVWFTESSNLLGKPLAYYKAVDDVSFVLRKGEVLGLVGESGCGKSTLSRALIGLLPVHSGQLLYKGQDLATYTPKQWNNVRRQIQMVFQDPYSSLNPRMTVGEMITEPLLTHNIVPKQELKKEALRLLDLVQLPATAYNRYPHQFSGGQRQRVGIARALALRPELLICDESVSALDVSIQAQILNLLKDLQAEFNLTYLFISHDLSVVHYISDRVLVMQAGKIVEAGSAEQVLHHPANAYTQRLIDAMP